MQGLVTDSPPRTLPWVIPAASGSFIFLDGHLSHPQMNARLAARVAARLPDKRE